MELMEDSQKQQATLSEIQRLVLQGLRTQAAQLAAASSLWSHAFCLSAHEPSLQSALMAQFADTTLITGSPLQTIYFVNAQASGRFSTDTTRSLLAREWSANVRAIVANPGPSSSNALVELGDVLWNSHQMPFEAQLCYLLAGRDHDCFLDPSARMVLVGADHRCQSRPFLSPSAIQRTEIYEFLKVSNNVLSPYPQVFKFVYALMLAEVGLNDFALQYCELAVSRVKLFGVNTFDAAFLEALQELTNRLKKVDELNKNKPLTKRILGGLGNLFGKAVSFIIDGAAEDKRSVLNHHLVESFTQTVVPAPAAQRPGATTPQPRLSSQQHGESAQPIPAEPALPPAANQNFNQLNTPPSPSTRPQNAANPHPLPRMSRSESIPRPHPQSFGGTAASSSSRSAPRTLKLLEVPAAAPQHLDNARVHMSSPVTGDHAPSPSLVNGSSHSDAGSLALKTALAPYNPPNPPNQKTVSEPPKSPGQVPTLVQIVS
jgi:hypothetical protein